MSHPPSKPISPHWADTTAFRIFKAKESGTTITVASGITPSGTVHVGNFREVVTAYFVAEALKDLGANVRFIYSWDNFDTFRKVPANLPNPEEFGNYLRKPLCDIPDPWKQASSYARGRMELFEAELTTCGIHPEYILQSHKYRAGTYGDLIHKAIASRHSIRKILNQSRTTPLPEDWYPVVCYCEACGRDTTKITRSTDSELSYSCDHCHHKSEVEIRSANNLKLVWRVDWPMRWTHEQVDFEPGGKDHSSQGGSYETASKIAMEVFGVAAPIYLPYDFVMVKNAGQKMSSSSGNLVSLKQCLKVYSPQMILWMFARERPNHDFSLALDEDVLRVYEEYDSAIKLVMGERPEASKKLKKYEQMKRIFALTHRKAHLADLADLPPLRDLCNQLQMMEGYTEKTYERFYQSSHPHQKTPIIQRLERASHWLKVSAPERFVFALRTKPPPAPWTDKEQQILTHLKALAESYELADLAPDLIHKLLYEEVIRPTASEPGEAFKVIYRALISKDFGPKLAHFLAELGSAKVRERL